MSGVYDMENHLIYRGFVGVGPRACPGGIYRNCGNYRDLPLHHPHLMAVGRGGFTGFTGERGLIGMQGVLLPTGRVVLDVFADAVQFGFVADDVFPIIGLP
ncbi:hypothetical protein KKHLCK_05315 [Candidatus Electrothrix laxa]